MKTFSFSVLTISLLFFANCCKEEPPVQKDPCEEIRNKKADFIIVQKWPNIFYSSSKDTINYKFGLNLKATAFDYVIVQWVVGTDSKRYTGDSLSLYLKQPYNSIKITMYGWRPIESCITGDDGVDTVIHNVVALADSFLNIYGVFRGVSNYFPMDTFNVSIRPFFDKSLFKSVYVLENFPNSCSPFKDNPSGYGMMEVLLFHNFAIGSDGGWIRYDSIMNTYWQYGYRYSTRGWKRKDGLYEFTTQNYKHHDSIYHFIGKKLK